MKRRKRNVTCLNCHSKRVDLFLIVDRTYTLYKCKSCSIVFTSPQLKTAKQVNKKIYNSREELESRTANFADEYNRAKEHVLEFKKYKKSGKYLDVGCSYGIGLKAAQDLGFDVLGVEPTKRAAEYAKENFKLKIMQSTLEEAKLKTNSFDVISLYDVLEHVSNPNKFLQEIKRVLKPKGLLVIQSPNIESFAFKLLTKNWNWLLVPNHLWHFSKRSVTGLLEETGFNVKKYATNDSVYDFSSNLTSKVFHYKISNTFGEKILQKLIYMVLYIAITIGSWIWINFGKGGSFQIYAIKR